MNPREELANHTAPSIRRFVGSEPKLLVLNRDTIESPGYYLGPSVTYVVISISGPKDRAKGKSVV